MSMMRALDHTAASKDRNCAVLTATMNLECQRLWGLSVLQNAKVELLVGDERGTLSL